MISAIEATDLESAFAALSSAAFIEGVMRNPKGADLSSRLFDNVSNPLLTQYSGSMHTYIC